MIFINLIVQCLIFCYTNYTYKIFIFHLQL